jgi:hypothetical protein
MGAFGQSKLPKCTFFDLLEITRLYKLPKSVEDLGSLWFIAGYTSKK